MSTWFWGQVVNNSSEPIWVWYSDANVPGGGVLLQLAPGYCTAKGYDCADAFKWKGKWYKVGPNVVIVGDVMVYGDAGEWKFGNGFPGATFYTDYVNLPWDSTMPGGFDWTLDEENLYEGVPRIPRP